MERIGEVVELIGVVKFDGGLMYLHIGLEGMYVRLGGATVDYGRKD